VAIKLPDQPGCKVYMNLWSLNFYSRYLSRRQTFLLKNKTNLGLLYLSEYTVIFTLGPNGGAL